MKLHFNAKTVISSLPPKIDVVKHGDVFIYYNSPSLCVASISTNKIIHKFKYENVQLLRIHNDQLYICTSDIYIVDLEAFELKDVIKLSKPLINRIAFSQQNILVSKMNNRVTYLSEGKKVFDFPVTSFCEGLFINEFYYGYYDLTKIAVFSNTRIRISEVKMEDTLGVMLQKEKVFALNTTGILIELISGWSADLEMEFNLCSMSEHSILAVSDGSIYEIDYTGSIIGKSCFLEMIEEYSGSVEDSFSNMRAMIGQNIDVRQSLDNTKKVKINTNDSSWIQADDESVSQIDINSDACIDSDGTCTESGDTQANFDSRQTESDSVQISSDGIPTDSDSRQTESDSRQISPGDSNALEISRIENDIIKTSENDFIFIKDQKIYKIISFVDDVTDSMKFENSLILSTMSGFLKYTSLSFYSEGEYLLDTRIVRISTDSITSSKIYNNILISGSKDKACQFFKIYSSGDRVHFNKAYELRNFRTAISSLAFDNNLLAIASSDNILQIYQTDQDIKTCMSDGSIEDYALYFSSFENISTQHIHSKAITHISITPKFIITSSTDKSSKVLGHDGSPIKTLQSDKVLNSSYDSKYIAICSHKAIKIYHSPSLTQLCVFNAKKPVLSSGFYNGYFLAVTDVLRVYDLDKKKCVKSYDLDLVNCWSFNYPFLSAESKILILEDISKQVQDELLDSLRTLREDTVLVDKFLRENKFKEAVGIFLRKGDSRMIQQAIMKGFYHHTNLDFLEEFMKNGESKAKIFDCLLKNAGFKNSELLNNVVGRFFMDKLDKSKKDKALSIIKKHSTTIDEVFIDLLSLDIFNK